MALPDLTEIGDLPVGVHQAPLTETVARFGEDSDWRRRIGKRLKRIHQIASETGHLDRFVVFGSFITDKDEPNDVDIFMLVKDDFDMGLLSGEAHLLFINHAAAQDHFGASVFWVRLMAALDGEQSIIEDWQIKRDGTKRGIVEIIGE